MKQKAEILLKTALILASIACIAFGIYRGEAETIFIKAINICMECIGLG